MKWIATVLLFTALQGPVVGQPTGTAPSSRTVQSQTVKVTDLPPVTVNPTKRDWADWGYWVFNALLVVVGFLQVVALFMQRSLIARQDEHFRNSERAWIMAELGWYDHSLRVTESASESGAVVVTNFTEVNVKLTCRNEGRTPAWIENLYGRVDIVASISREAAPEKSSLHSYGLLPPLGAGSEKSRSLQLTCAGHRVGGSFLVAYVLIEYRDIFGIKRETNLGYSIDSKGNLYRQEALRNRNTNT